MILTALLTLAAIAPPGELGELLDKLRERDLAAEHLFLPYSARSDRLVEGRPAWEEQGWWLYSEVRVAYGLRTTHGEGEVEAVHGSWDGARLHQSRGGDPRLVPTWEERARAGGERSIGEAFDSDELQRAHTPGMFGVRFVHHPWSNLLSDGRKRQLLGRAQLEGRATQAVLFEVGQSPPDGQEYEGYLAPVIAFFDVESLLAVRVQIYAAPGALEQYGATEELLEPHVLVIDGTPWAVFQEWSVDAVQELEGGIHVPLAGRITYPACPNISGSVMELDVGAATAGRAPPAHLLEVAAQEPDGAEEEPDSQAPTPPAAPGR